MEDFFLLCVFVINETKLLKPLLTCDYTLYSINSEHGTLGCFLTLIYLLLFYHNGVFKNRKI